MKTIYLADWVRNTIDLCEVLSERGRYIELKRARSNPINVLVETGCPNAQRKVCATYKAALDWIKENRLAQIEKIKAQLAAAEKRLTEVVQYYD